MLTPHVRDWIDYLQALAPSIAVMVAISVGITQAVLQRQKFKQNLYQQRFAVYKGLEEYILSLIRGNGKEDLAAYYTFRNATDPARFLFRSDVYNHVRHVGQSSLDLAAMMKEMEFDQQVMQSASSYADTPAKVTNATNRYYSNGKACHKLRKELFGILEAVSIPLFLPEIKLVHDKSWWQRLEDHMDKKTKELEKRQAE